MLAHAENHAAFAGTVPDRATWSGIGFWGGLKIIGLGHRLTVTAVLIRAPAPRLEDLRREGAKTTRRAGTGEHEGTGRDA